MTRPTRAWYEIAQGELSDMPGRNESWTEAVAYLGDNRWALRLDGTDFTGRQQQPPQIERRSTKRMTAWCRDRDADDRESELIHRGSARREGADDDDDADDIDPGPGPRTVALLAAARAEGAAYCVRLLTIGRRSRPQRKVRVTKILGVTRRQVWIRAWHEAIGVETNLEPGYIVPVSDDARVVRFHPRKGGPFRSSGEIRLTKAQAPVVREMWANRPREDEREAAMLQARNVKS